MAPFKLKVLSSLRKQFKDSVAFFIWLVIKKSFESIGTLVHCCICIWMICASKSFKAENPLSLMWLIILNNFFDLLFYVGLVLFIHVMNRKTNSNERMSVFFFEICQNFLKCDISERKCRWPPAEQTLTFWNIKSPINSIE